MCCVGAGRFTLNARKRSAPGSSETLDMEDAIKPSIEPNNDLTFSIECPICLEEMEEPKLLHCGHNLCQKCAAKTGKITKERTIHLFKLECPLCKSTTSLNALGGLNTNIELRNTIEKAKKMKLDLETKIAELTTKTAMETVKCAECSSPLALKDALGCNDYACSTQRLITVRAGCLTYGINAVHRTTSQSINISIPKALCSQCAWRSHRDHGEHVKGWVEFTSEKDRLDMAKELGEMMKEVNELFDGIKDSEWVGNLFDEIMSEWKYETHVAIRRINDTTPSGQLRNEQAESKPFHNVKRLHKRIKEFIGSETRELRSLSSQFRHEINRSFKKGMSSRSPSPSPSRAWSRSSRSRHRSTSPYRPDSMSNRSRSRRSSPNYDRSRSRSNEGEENESSRS